MIGTKVRELRKNRQLTIAELASKLGISESYLSQLESERVDPSVSLVRKLAAELQVSIAVFFDTEYEKPTVTRWNERAIETVRDGEVVLSSITPKSDRINLFMKEFQIRPETAMTYTTDTYHTSLYITEGMLTVQFADTEAVLYAGDSIFLPADIRTTIRNESPEPAKGLFCTKDKRGGIA